MRTTCPIDLKPFCITEPCTRYGIAAPFRQGRWVFATNGHILVRVMPWRKMPQYPRLKSPPAALIMEDAPAAGYGALQSGTRTYQGEEVFEDVSGDTVFAATYMALIRALPRVLVQVDAKARRLWFKFDGGAGALMAMEKLDDGGRLLSE